MRAVRKFVLGILVVSTFAFVSNDGNDTNRKVKLKVIAHTFQDLNSDITLDISKNGTLKEKDIANTRNRFALDLELNEVYDVHIKQPGCQGKVLQIDTDFEGMAKGSLSYVIEIYMKKEVVGSLEKDVINFHLFHGINDKTMLMLQDG